MNLIAELRGRRLLRRLAKKQTPQIQGGAQELKLVWIPVAETAQHEGSFMARLNMPGLEPRDISLEPTPFGLAIQARKRRNASAQADGDTLLNRKMIGSFERLLALPEDLDKSHLHVGYDEGVLTLILHKPENQEPHAVEQR